MKLLLALTLMAATALAGDRLPPGTYHGIDTDGGDITVQSNPNSQVISINLEGLWPMFGLWNPLHGSYVVEVGSCYFEFWEWVDTDGNHQWFWYRFDSITGELKDAGTIA